MQALTLDELINEFDELGDWEAKCDYLIDIGLDLEKLPLEAKVEANRVHGCQSNVWMIPKVSTTPDRTIDFQAESDSMLVSGLISVLKLIYSGKSPDEVMHTDIKQLFTRLGLDRQLSPQRKNGLFGMVQRIKEMAQMHLIIGILLQLDFFISWI